MDLVLLTGILSNVETLWEEPGIARGFDRLAESTRLILMDRRGVGMSDRFERPATPDEDVADVEAVLDAAGSETAAVYGTAGGAIQAVQFAHALPQRTRALILYAGFIKTTRADDMPWAPAAEERTERFEYLLEHWGEGANTELLAPSAAGDDRIRAWFSRLERTSVSPGTMRMLWTALGEQDGRPLLAEITVPTLILHRADDQLIDVQHSRYMAERIPGARYVELPGQDHLVSLGDSEAVHGEIVEFLTGAPRTGSADRCLLTVLFTDIVDGTARAAEFGDDARWRSLLAAHDAEVRTQLVRFGGREVKTTGDGFLAVFDGPPSPAIRCAKAIVEATAGLGVEIRAGLHTGECEVIGDDVAGMAVNIAARVCAKAEGRQVLASGTTFGTVVGSGMNWQFLGAYDLKGVPGEWPIFRLR